VTPARAVLPPPVPLPARGRSGLREDQFKALRASFPGIDIQEMECRFVAWNDERGVTPEKYAGALHGFIKQKLRRVGEGAE
jgi:hypothetical protein